MARPKVNYEPQRKALARLAFDLFAENGYERTTITHIMKAAGLTKAGMYHYYNSKEEILDAAIEYCMILENQMILKEMEGLTVEEKMLHFIQGASAPNEFMEKIIQVKKNDNNSYAAYRIREKRIHSYIPIMENILREGLQNGVYRLSGPRETAELIILYTSGITETNLLPPADSERTMARINLFLELMIGWLNPSSAHAKQITDLFHSYLLAHKEQLDEQN